MTAAAPALGHALDITSTQPIPFARLVKIELRKSYDTRAGFWLLGIIGLLVLATEAIALAVTTVQDEPMAWGDFVGAAAFVTAIILPVLGIMLVTSEWGQRTGMVTFTLEPRRSLVIVAKVVTGLLLTLATALISVGIGAFCNLLYVLIQGNGSWDLGWNYLFGFVITQSFAMLGGLALATMLLNTPAAIVLFFVYKWVLPGLFALGSALIGWFSDLSPWLDFQAAQGPVYDLTLNTGAEWGHLIVSGVIWLVLPLAVGLRRILRAEVK